jgi:hypothetical protein
LADEIGLRRVAERNDSNPERDLCKSAADFQSAEESVAFLTGSADKMSAARCFAEVSERVESVRADLMQPFWVGNFLDG